MNKVSTRVEVSFDVLGSAFLGEVERALVLSRLRSRIDASGTITVSSDSSRSQWQNRREALEKLCDLLRAAVVPRRPRVATRPSRASKRKRREQKQRRSATKQLRRVKARGNRGEE